MRILAVHHFVKGDGISAFAGGGQRAASLLGRYLLEHGHQLAILPFPEIIGNQVPYTLAEERIATVFPTVVLPSPKEVAGVLVRTLLTRSSATTRSSLPWRVVSSVALRRALDMFEPDVIHNHHARSAFGDLYMSLGCRIPALLTHTHGIGNRLGIYNAVVFYSRFQQSLIVDRGLLRPDQGRVIHAPVHPLFLGSATPRSREGLVFVGVLRERKGLDILLSACRLDRDLNQIPLHVCGDGPLRQQYEAFAREHGLNASFHGRVSLQKLRDFLSNAELLVLPSREESWGIVYQESLCCGTPFIGYPPTVRELEDLWSLEVGFAFDASTHDAEDLAKLIRGALAHDILAPSYRDMLMERARAYFTVERFGSEYIKCYTDVIGA